MAKTPFDWEAMGGEAFSPLMGPPDPVANPDVIRTQPDAHFLGDASPDLTYLRSLPSPSVGGSAGEYGRLGYSTGLGQFRMRNVMQGQAITPHATELTVGGPVGFKSNELAGRLDALYSNYTPSAPEVAQDWLSSW